MFEQKYSALVRIVYFLFFFSLVLNASAQGVIDSIRAALQHEPQLILGLHNRNTFVNANNVKLYGLKLGWDYNKKAMFYVGAYGLSNSNRKWLVNDDRFQLDSIQRRTHYYNISLGLSYTLDAKPQILIRMPVQIGIGNVVHDHYGDGEFIFRNNDLVVPLEAGIDITYWLIPYIALKAGAGYRLSLGNEDVMRLSSPYYNLGVAIPLRAVYDDFIAPEL